MTWIEQVARATGLTVQSVRLALQAGWEIGTAIKLNDSRIYTYIPYPAKIKELIGIDINEGNEGNERVNEGGKDDEGDEKGAYESAYMAGDRISHSHTG